MKRCLAALLLLTACQSNPQKPSGLDTPDGKLLFPGEEKHLRNVRQLTFGGQNAEAYFSADGNWLIFQSQRDGYPCDEMYVMRTDGTGLRKVSGKGRATCGYFFGLHPTKNEPSQIVFASTHADSPDCPPKPDYSRGYVWPIYNTYELYSGTFSGEPLRRMTANKFYDAEATVSPDQAKIVFTSTRHGDLDLYVMNVDGTGVRRITRDPGYDGGAFFSHDGKSLVYRAYHPGNDAEKAEYKENLKAGVYKPTWLEIFTIGVDGRNKRQVTKLGGGSFAPYFFPNDRRIIFSSNYKNPRGRTFELYAVDLDGQNLEQITYSDTFDSFPMFSPDGRRIVWASNRSGKVPGETNIFLADWLD